MQSLVKKRCKLRRNRPINGNAMLVRTMHPSNEQRTGLGAWQKNIQTSCFRIYRRRALDDLPQTLHDDRGRRAHQKGAIHFLIQRIVFPTGCTEQFGLIDRRAVSQRWLRNLWCESHEIWNANPIYIFDTIKHHCQRYFSNEPDFYRLLDWRPRGAARSLLNRLSVH